MSRVIAIGVNNLSFPSPKILNDVNPKSPDRDPECYLLS